MATFKKGFCLIENLGNHIAIETGIMLIDNQICHNLKTIFFCLKGFHFKTRIMFSYFHNLYVQYKEQFRLAVR